MRFTFVHAADLHLDTPFAGVGQSSEEVARELREASLAAWDGLVDLTVREKAAFLVLAGDIYDGAGRGLRAQLRFLAGLERLAAAGVRVFVVHGNHDPLDEGWSAVRQWPPGVTFFGSVRPEAAKVELDGRTIATVYGMSYAVGDERRNLAGMFQRAGGPGLHVGVLHTNAGGDPEHGPYAPCSVQDLAAAGMDYWALGHVHRQRFLQRGQPWIAYPGCLQGRSPQPGELGPKGALVVECDSRTGVAGEPRFVEIGRVRFDRLEVDVAATPDLAGALAVISREVWRLRSESPGRGLLLRVRAHGAASWAPDLARVSGPDLARAGGPDAVRSQLQEELAGAEPFVWVSSLALDVEAPVDRERLRGRGDLAAEVVAQADALAADPEALAGLLKTFADELAPHGLSGVAAGQAARDPQALLRLAEARCLSLIAGGGEPR